MFRKFLRRAGSITAGQQCAALCALALLAGLAPGDWFAPGRASLERLLAPGQKGIAPGIEAARRAMDRAAALWSAAGEVQRLTAQVEALALENRELSAQLKGAASPAPASSPKEFEALPTDPLLQASLVSARVVGRQARSYLARRDLLDVGAQQRARPEAFVLGTASLAPVLVDLGQDAGLAAHQRVLAPVGGAQVVWGKLVDVGRVTSTLRRATDAGYRDLVRLARVTPSGLQWGMRGLLEGVGEPHCRLTRVDVDASVDIGDLVFATDPLASSRTEIADDADTAASAPLRLLYGTVVRLERPAAEPHWRIWVEPAAGIDREPTQVAVVTLQLNPARLSRQPPRSAVPESRR